MISAWWLFLIVPCSMYFGVLIVALCHAASRRDDIDS